METTLEHATPTKPVRPWLYIWFKPRGTMRQILDYNPKYGVILLGFLAGAVSFLSGSLFSGPIFKGSPLRTIVFTFVFGVAYLFLGIFLFGAYAKWAVSLFGGRGSVWDTRAALAWPMLPSLILWVAYTVLIHFFNSSGLATGNPLYYLTRLADDFIQYYGLFISIKCMAEAHSISSWRALAAYIFSVLLLVIPILAILFMIKVNG
jgi:hypothetical protein